MARPKLITGEPSRAMIEAAFPILLDAKITSEARARRVIREIWREMYDMAEDPEQPPPGLTKRQHELHVFLAEFMIQNNTSPTYQEITDGLGYFDKKVAYERIQSLCKKKRIRIDPRRRKRKIRMIRWPLEVTPPTK